MKRWNGWGDERVEYPLQEGPRRYLAALVGKGTPPKQATLQGILAQVPASRLPVHPLISVDAEDRLRHSRGQSLPDWIALRCGTIPVFSDGVTFPHSEEHVREILNYATATGAKLIPYGGGSSVVGHINPVAGIAPVLTVALGRLNRLRRFDRTSQLATFEAGVSGPNLEAQLRAKGCTLGHYPQSFEMSTLGGWIVSRSSGQQSLGYGRIERLFAGGRLESPAGSMTLAPHPASAAGPDLREVVLGSEGRLGFLTEATVRVSPLPEQEDFHAVFFPDFGSGMVAVRDIMQSRVPLSMLRLSTATETKTTLALAGRERLIGTLERLLALRSVAEDKCMLLMGFTGREEVVQAARRVSLEAAREQGGVHVGRSFGREWHKSRFRTPYLRNTLWDLGYAIDTLETATDWGTVPKVIDGIESALRDGLEEVGERVHVFTHLSHLYPYGSSIYTTYLFRIPHAPDAETVANETLRRWSVLKASASEAIIAHGGTISHQHGIGTDHMPYMAVEKGRLGMATLHDLCQRFDPEGIMNPGKLV